MMRALSTPLLAALLVAAASPSFAAPPAAPAPAATGVMADVRCLLTMAALASNKERQQAGQVGVYYFAGRINQRAPGFDLSAAVKAQAPLMGPKELQEEFKRCGPIVGASAQAVQAALGSLRPPGPPPGPPPGAPPAAAMPGTVPPPK
jgi:hypothetical protein